MHYYLRRLGIRYFEDVNFSFRNSKRLCTFFYNELKYKSLILDTDIDDIILAIKGNNDFCIQVKRTKDIESVWICFCSDMLCSQTSFMSSCIVEDHTIFTNDYGNRKKLIKFAFNNFHYIDENDSKDNFSSHIEPSTSYLYELLRNECKNVMYNQSILNYCQERILLDLRPYQIRAIQWLYYRETISAKVLSPEFCKLKCYPGFYKEHKNVHFLLNKKSFEIVIRNEEYYITLPSGGILADEMGLGKTIEILSLILINNRKNLNIKYENSIDLDSKHSKIFSPKKRDFDMNLLYCICGKLSIKNLIRCSNCQKLQHAKCVLKYVKDKSENYNCPQCWEDRIKYNLIKSSATVIVSPQTILDQWFTEIIRNSKVELKIFYYKGFLKGGWISPKDLADYDIILTSYNVLNNELNYTREKSYHNLRLPRTYIRIKSPLLLVEWWRVCLDEAQMVENTTTKVARMVKLLPAINRWAVTGTPIQKSIDDLKGLLEFLEAYPFYENQIWNELINAYKIGCSEDLLKILGKLMWRTCKLNVLHEISLPPQLEIVHFLKMSNSEILYYQANHHKFANDFEFLVQKYSATSISLLKLDSRTVKLILQPFVKLREICTSPIVFQKSTGSKTILRPHELLDHLKTTNENNCKMLLRTMASSYNGIAAVYIIQSKYDMAIQTYKKVLALSKKYTGAISVDSLLQIHAIHNLMYARNAMKTNKNNSIDNYRDEENYDKYENECIQLEWKYLKSYNENLIKTKEHFSIVYNETLDTIKSHKLVLSKIGDWWRYILNYVELHELDNQIIKKIIEERNVFNIHKFKTIHGINFTLALWTDKVIATRNEIIQSFSELENFLNNVRARNELSESIQKDIKIFIKSVVDCHLTPILRKDLRKRKLNKCDLCKISSKMKIFECLIFNKTMDKDEDKIQGDWNPTIQETILKIIISFAKSKAIDLVAVKQGEVHLQILEHFKKEHKILAKLWIEYEYTIKAYDELDMCKMRLEAIDLPQVKNSNKQINTIVKDKIQETLHENQNSFLQAEREFSLTYGRLNYIRHLESKKDPGTCPICSSELRSQYSVLKCGHLLCSLCFQNMKDICRQKITCALCRNCQFIDEVYFVAKKNEDDIQGKYSTKIKEIVRNILQLKQQDLNVKILIFSQWSHSIQAISYALSENSISFKVGLSPENVQSFKDHRCRITCFLLPLAQGNKGLNLVEATHVFLVEPTFNYGEELQAISRVHRIGQTRETTVHKFIVRNTIEEAIHNTLQSLNHSNDWDVDINNIRSLFAAK